MKQENPFVAYYGEHAISPVRQDISDLEIHLKRRANLYRTLGIPSGLFKGHKVLEVGPGGGYNALAVLAWGAHMDFVEPNPTAQQELPALFAKYGIPQSQWTLFSGLIEDFQNEVGYDIVLAEGFLPGLYQREVIIDKLRRVVNPGSVIVLTCIDEISNFMEILKRLVAYQLVKDRSSFAEKVTVLAQAFESHIKTLQFSSRPIEDWVMDNLLNPAMLKGKMFSIADCIEEFGSDFDFIGSSPNLFTNYSWYKDVNFDYRMNVLEQFKEKRHVLLLWDLTESVRNGSQNEKLIHDAKQIRELINHLWSGENILEQIIASLREFLDHSQDIDPRIPLIINQVIDLLCDSQLTSEKVANANFFAKAFGRGQQYVSLQKKFDL